MVDDATSATRVFAAGRADFVVRSASPAIRDTIDDLFADLPTGHASNDPIEIVVTDIGADGWALRFGDEERSAGQPPDWAVARLITGVSRLALDAEPERLHLHCAALARNGCGVLISAEAGTGKTTLAAALLQHGWTYATDEMVSVELDDPIARSFPKPLSLKPGGHLLPGILDAQAPIDPDRQDDPWVHVRAGSLGVRVDDQVEPTAIVILHRAFDGRLDVEHSPVAMHPVDAVVALMGQTMDPQRYGPDAVTTLAQFAARCRCVTLAVGPLDHSVSRLAELVETAPDPLPSRHLILPSDFDLAGWTVADDVRSIVIGERAVVHDTAGGAIVAFDESGTALWEALHGVPPDWWPHDAVAAPGTTDFLSALEANGFVRRIAHDRVQP